MTIPHRGRTSDSTYFVTANVLDKKTLFQVEKIAHYFVEVLFDYRKQGKYYQHEFVVMPDHFHLIISPLEITLERAMQFIKGGFSFRLNRSLKVKRDAWQPSFFDRRVRDSLEYQKYKDYIWQNPVKRGLVKSPEQYLQLSKSYIRSGSGTSAAKAGFFFMTAAGLKACSTP